MSGTPKVLNISELPTSEAKWITLKKIKYQDAEGNERLWECAERTTRKSDIDAVAIFTVIKSSKNAFPPSTVIVEQYRPPINKFVIEMPAGLVDKGETAEQAAIRELEEETGFVADNVVETSPLIVCDPGMTTANMKLVTLSVTLPDKLEIPDQKLDAGEFITRRVIPLSTLEEELKEYDKKGFAVDARLFHFAAGLKLSQQLHF